jgi:succinyl-CoA:acetate CoA-transferase
MDAIRERIRHAPSIGKIKTADETALLFRDGMLVATTGNPFMGYPRAVFTALIERMKREGGIVIDLLSAGPLGPEVEDAIIDAGGIRTKIGAVGTDKMRDAINQGKVKFLEGKGGQLPLQVKRGWYGPLDVAVVEAVGLTGEGHIIPTTAVYDTPEWVDAAHSVIVEINLSCPEGLEGIHDVYQRGSEPIPITDNALKRIGVPYIRVDPDKVKAIVISDLDLRSMPENKPDRISESIGRHILDFFHREIRAGRLPEPLPPLEVGVGALVENVLRTIGTSDFRDLRLNLPSITDPVIDIIARGKVQWATGTALRLTSEVWKRFTANLDEYKKKIVLRPVSISSCPELIQRLGVIAINGCLEMDIQGQVNSSHVLGTRILTGIAGSYDYSRNGLYSIFVGPSTARGGKISAIVPSVAHVDHTEHDVDILVTEQGLADLRGLDPREKAETIIRHCAHPDYREMLSEYLARAQKEPGHIPVLLEESHSFHTRLKRTGSMKDGD